MPPSDDNGASLLDIHTGHVLRSAMADSEYIGLSKSIRLWYEYVTSGMIFRAPDIIRLVLLLRDIDLSY